MFSVAAGNIELPLLNVTYTNNQPINYLALWQDWQKQALPGSGEFRELAVERLMGCLENESATLDLTDLELTSVPELLPPHIETLLLSHNQLTWLPANFPPSLKTVFIDNNSFTTHTIAHLQTLMSAPDYHGPVIYFREEDRLHNERHSLLQGDDKALQTVLSDGREIRLKIEDEIKYRHWLKDIFTPRTSLLAGGILAGIALISGTAIYLRRQWAPSNTNNYPPAGNALFQSGQRGHYGRHDPALPAAQALMDETAKPDVSIQPTHSPADAIPAEKINAFLRNEIPDVAVNNSTKEGTLSHLAGWLFPAGKPYEESQKVIKLAKFILRCTGDYGGKERDSLSLWMAKAVIRQWVIKSLLQKPLREYIAERIVSDKEGRYQTMGSLKQIISLPAIFFDGKLNIDNIPAVNWDNFEAMWLAFIKAEIPLIDDNKFAGIQDKKFAEYESLALYTGALYLQDQQLLDDFNLPQITETGAAIWGQVISGRNDTDMLPWLIAPALWFVASSAPELLQNVAGSYEQVVIPTVLDQWRTAQQQAHKIQSYITAYEDALAVWESKGTLADKFIARCPLDKIKYIPNRADDILTQAQINKKIRAGAKERYLLNIEPPCNQDNVPPSLAKEYNRVTTNVANAFKNLEKLLIEGALFSADKAEYDFICSDSAKLYPAFLRMRTPTPFEIMAPTVFGGATYAADIFVRLVNTDIFAVVEGNEERIYGLKKGEGKNEGYTLYRLDRDVRLYIEHDVLSHKHFWQNYKIIDGKVKARGYEFNFEIRVPKERSLYKKSGSGSEAFIEHFSEQYRQIFYNKLFQSGNDRSATENFWLALKPIIPFYDCIEGLASNVPLQKTQAVFSCFLDVLSLIPVVGQATAIGGKFGLSLAQGMRSGVLKISQGATAKAAASALAAGITLPAIAEMRSLFITALRAFDPGFELLLRGGAQVSRIGAAVSDSGLAAKLQSVAAQAAQHTSSYKLAVLPVTGLEVSIKQVGRNVWVRVNPQTGEGFGHYYSLNNDNQLTEITAEYRPVEEGLPAGSQAAGPVLLQAGSEYQHLPEAPGHSSWWNTVRGVNNWLPSLDEARQLSFDGTIQPLIKFLPEPPLWVENVAAASETITLDINHYYTVPWRAWAGAVSYAPDIAPPWLAQMQATLRLHAQQSLRTFEDVWILLWRISCFGEVMSSSVGSYLMGLLRTQRADVIHEAFLRLKNIVKRGFKFLKAVREVDYSNFVIVSSDLQVDPANPSRYISMLPEAFILDNLPFACVLRSDPETRIIFFADKFHNNLLLPTSITDTLNHEVTHVSSNTGDLFVHFYPESENAKNGEGIYQTFGDNFVLKRDINQPAIIYERQDFRNFISNLMISQGITQQISEADIFIAIFSDPMLLANLMMSDAQVITTIIRDLAAAHPFDAAIRTKRETEAAPQNQTGWSEESFLNSWLTLTVVEALRVGINVPA